MMKTVSLFCTGLVGAFLLTNTGAFAQNTQQGTKERNTVVSVQEDRVFINGQGPEPGMPLSVGVGGGPNNTFVFVNSEFSFDGKLTKNAPYSADAVTETTQNLGDGNRIVRKNTATIYRDSEGRTRREQSFNAIGPYASTGDVPQTTFINDPVSGVNYILDSRTKTARKMDLPQFNFKPGQRFEMKVDGPFQGPPQGPPPGDLKPGTSVVHSGVATYGRFPGPSTEFVLPTPPGFPKHEPKVESLGTQQVEGVNAEGTRTTLTIPAGEIGNERQIEIVNEKWYSPELQVVVMSKRIDPLAGDMTYRLTNINRNEPAKSLFEVPSDYKIKEGPAIREFKRMVKPVEQK
jgi:hypothetical protein